MKASQAVELLQSLPPDSEVVFEVWKPEDVHTQAKEMGYHLTERQIVEVLTVMERNSYEGDRSFGHSWDTIEDAINEVAAEYCLTPNL